MPGARGKRRYCSDRCRQRASRARRAEAAEAGDDWSLEGLTDAERAIRFLENLSEPEGPAAGEPVRLAPFQREFVLGALDPEVQTGVLSIGRGNGKSALSAGLALGALVGVWDRQPRREILIAARTRDQAAVAHSFAVGFAQTLPPPCKGS